MWRLRHLYSCKKEGTGEAVPFRMRPEQEQVISSLYDDPLSPVYIIKARRLGLSTGIGIAMTDFCSWNGGASGALIERTMDFAGEKMRNILRFSFNSMDPELLCRFDVKHRDSPAILDPIVKGLADKYRSEIKAGVAARGGDCAWLWVSEWGPIAHKDPSRSEEIKTGAFPAARMGRRVVETTWMGGRSGDLWDLIKPIMERDPDTAGKLMFFPWHGDPECVRMDGGAVSAQDEEYFRTLAEKTGRRFTQEQKRWFVVTKKEQGIFMGREYPSTLEEAFSAPVEGALYANEIAEARVAGRIGRMPVDGNTLVHTFWDLGAPKNTRVWYGQTVGRFIRLLRCDMGTEETIVQRWARMKGNGYNYGNHFMPHDVQQTARSGKTLATECAEAGMVNVRTVPRTADEWLGINHLKGLFPSLEFDSEGCKEALEVLPLFHVDKDTGEPVHDDSSHTADALRTMAEAHAAGMFKFSYADLSGLPDDHRAHRRRGARAIRVGG